MKNGHKTVKVVWSLLLAMILCLQGLVPAMDFGVEDYPVRTGLTYAIAEESPKNPPASAGTNDLDGSKIEGIKVVWVTQDSRTNNEGQAVSQDELDDVSHLYLATTGSSALSMVYKIEAEFSGQYDYGPGDITITIPAQVWHGRQYESTGDSGETVGVVDDSRLIGSLQLPLPAAPSKKADFNWQVIDGNYVLTNTRTIGATSSVSIEVAITGINPMSVVDMSETDLITAHCEVVTNQGNTIELTSLPISAQLDTQAKITSAYKNGEVYEEYPGTLSNELLANLPEGTNPEDYVYVRWYTYHSHVNNQPFSLDITDVLSDAYENVDGEKRFVTEGIFLGSTNYKGEILKEGDLDFTAEIADHINVASSGTQYSHTVYMWSAYRKDAFYVPRPSEPQRVYFFENEVQWILTETDKGVEADQWNKPEDPQKVTKAKDNVIVPYAPVRYGRPTGHFIVNKWTESVGYKDYTYGYALNRLENKEPVDMNFVVETLGYGYPWTSPLTQGYDMEELVGKIENGELESLDLSPDDFGILGWKQITHDFQTFFNYETTPLTSEDFEMKGLRISVPGKMRYAKRSNGTWGYQSDSTLPTPDLLIEYQLNNEDTWYTAATATWGEIGLGSFQFVDVSEQCSTSGMTVYFPENVTDVRHTFVSNVFGGKTAERCDIAMIDWYVYPIITMKPSERVCQIVKELFEQSDNPSTKFKNDVVMDVYGWVGEDGQGTLVLDDDFDSSLATYAGASYGVSLNKSGSYTSDYENQRLLIRYTATLTEQSNLKVRDEYDAAVADGIIPAETSGVWYDLLPPHVIPMLDTVKLRDGDTITNIYTIDNYKDTGRILLVVEADLTPKPISSNSLGYADKPTLSFTAIYTWLDMNEYGSSLVNYVAFESTTENLRHGTLGTIDNQKGEPDDPRGGNNATTPSMPADILDAMTGLNPNTQPGENRFVYGKCSNSVSSLTYAVSGLDKNVSNDLVGLWTQGLDGQEQVTVYEGHNYTYRLRVASAETTSTKGIIIYDTIENYIIPDPNADQDTDATKAADFVHTQERKEWSGDWQGKGQWRGTLKEVDLSEFVNAGVAPVLLYSELPGLQFADSSSGTTDDNFDEDTELFSSGTYDITNRQIWQVAELDEKGVWTVPDGLNVSAIAIDATTSADGSEFILKPEASLCGYLHMVAPDDNSDPDVWHAKGAYARNEDGSVDWEAAMDPENNMYAFNNARVRLMQGQTNASGTNWLSEYRMIRNDYTRVGIIPGIITLEKKWQDQNNHDGLRPETVTVAVMRRVAGMAGEAEPVLDARKQPVTAVLSEENGWKAQFTQLDIVNELGLRYLYTFVEEPVEGYESKVQFVDATHYIITNIHPNEQIPIEGEKIWDDEDDARGFRPQSITLKLYRDDDFVTSKVVTAGADGSWHYSFGKMDKYAEGGHEYVYRVEEDYVPKYADEAEGYAIVNNNYYPLGDLEVLKTVENATPEAAKKVFTFTLVLLNEQTDPEEPAVPLMDKYHYAVYEQSGDVWSRIAEGEIGNGDTFQLMDGQKIRVENLPSESTYQVVETELAGFTVTSVDEEGTIRAGETARAEFTNTYSAKGSTQLSVTKNLSGREIRKNQFRFELVDNNPESATYGQVIRTARVNAPEADATIGGNGEEILSGADAIFGQLDYTDADAGKTFQYIVREENIGADGFSYDAAEYPVTVTVADETGDGNLTVTHNYMENSITFDNSYSAEGEVVLKAWKVLEGRPLAEGEFTFELYPYNPENGEISGECIGTATNDAEGNVAFDALIYDQNDVSLNDEEPATYHYLMQEKAGGDNTVDYSPQVYFVDIKVYDNGDGTLSFVQDQQSGVRTFVDCPDCDGAAAGGFPEVLGLNFMTFNDGPTGSAITAYDFCPECYGFAYVGGQLCTACVGSGFKLGGIIDYANSQTPNWYYTFTEYVQPVPGQRGYAIAVNSVNPKTHTYKAQTIIEVLNQHGAPKCDTCGGAGKTEGPIQVSGEASMPVFENILKPGGLSLTKEVQGAGSSNPNQEFTFHVKLTGEVPEKLDFTLDGQQTPAATPTPTPQPSTGSSAVTATPAPTRQPVVKAHKEPVVNPEVTPFVATDLAGEAMVVLNYYSGELIFFRAEPNADGSYTYNGAASKNADVTFSFSSSSSNNTAINANGQLLYFYRGIENTTYDSTHSVPWYTYRSKVKTVSMEGDYKPKNMAYFFAEHTNLTSVELNRWDASAATNMNYMFDNCSKLQSLDLSTWDTRNVTSMYNTFNGCTSLKSIDFTNFNTSKVTNMNRTFDNCKSLTSLDLSSFDTSKVTNMGGMFDGCSGLTFVDVSSFDTSNVQLMPRMFEGCSSLTSLDLSNFDIRKVTSTYYMFADCKNLTSVDVSSFDFSVSTYYVPGMFKNCSKLTSIDLSNFDTSIVNNMSEMFSGCSGLTELDLSTFDTSIVTDMNNMFYGCTGLKELDLSTFNTSKVKNMQRMFYNCSGLTKLEVGTFNTSNVTNMSYMFYGCKNLQALDLNGFDTGKITNSSYMFYDCSNLSLVTIGNASKFTSSMPYTPTRAPYDGKWIEVNDQDKILSASQLFTSGNNAGTWTWKKEGYKLNFDPGEGSGSMPSVWVELGAEYSFVPTFFRFGYDLVGFTDGTNQYPVIEDTVTIPANNPYRVNQTVTLTAQWEESELAVTLEENQFTVTLRAGETITFENIPASVGYEVWEDTPAGWVLVKKVNETGVIQPLQTSEVVFTNEYTPDKTSAALRASKLMDEEGAAAGAFTFTLSENGTVLQTKKNSAGGGISFDLIQYGKGDVGVHTYTIAEVPGNDSTIAYDSSVYTVTVTVADDGEGNLSSTVEYQGGEAPVFQNFTKPGNLTIRKTTQGATEAAASQTFTVEIRFTDKMGQPWSGTVTANGNEYTVAEGLLTATMGNGSALNITGIPAGVHYEVSEPDLLPGWVMDIAKTGVIHSTQTSSADLLNVYGVKGVAAPRINKVLAGRTLEEDEFSFQLVDPQNYVIGTASNAADGSVVFPDITFDAEGTYYFAAVEVPGSDDTVTYSGEVVFVTITMADVDGKGLLTPTITYTLRDEDSNFTDGANIITNSIKPGKLSVSKKVVSSNAAHASQAFTFTLLLTDALGQPISGRYYIEKNGDTEYFTVNEGSGTFTLMDGETALISGLPHGASYAVTEAVADGFTQKQNGANGSIVANQTASASFTNTYAAKGDYTPAVFKKLTGKDLAANDFVFALLDEDGYELLTARNDETGNVSFPAITFTDADVGTKVYQLVEKNSGVAGVNYDTTVQTITLTISDNGDGTLLISDDLNGQPVQFGNTYSDKTFHTVNKVWLDEENALKLRPAAIDVELYQNKVKYQQATLSEEGGWTHTFTDLPAFDSQGVKYTYEVREVPMPGYTTGINTEGNVTTLTNMPMGMLEVTKTVTVGNLEKEFPFTVTLAQNGEPLTGSYPAVDAAGETTVEVSAEGTCTFRLKHGETMRIMGLPVGAEYSVTEVTGDGYQGEVTEGNAEGIIQRNSLNRVGFTNSAKTTTFRVTKVWEGGSGAITLTLYANGVKMDPQPKYTREGDVYTYESLRMYDDDGLTIEYSAKEKYFDGFVTIYENVAPYENVTNMVHNGGTIINRQIREADFQVYKRWRGLDENATPPAITLTLYCNGVKMDYDTPRPSNGWYKYYGLPDYYNGEPAVYTVVEEPLPGYETSYEDVYGNKADCAGDCGTIINTRIPGTGDAQPIGLWMGLAGLSLLALLALALRKRKNG